jgi:hypothetical protein
MTRMKPWLLIFLLPVFSPCALTSQTHDAQVPAHSVFTIQSLDHVPLRVGQPVRAELVYPVYVGASLVIPTKTVLTGTVIALRPDRAKRVRSRFNLDFTPFRIPVVLFTQIALPGGDPLPIETDPATDGEAIVHFTRSPSGKQHNFLHREFVSAIHFIGDRVVFFTAQGRGDRLLQLAYHQLPWHPQRIERGTTWAVDTDKPFTVPESAMPQVDAAASLPGGQPRINLASLIIEATLTDTLSSATAKPGQTVHAEVAAPVFNDDHTVAVPQGAILLGTVSEAQPSRKFGRSGTLHFAFHEIDLPSGAQQPLTANLFGGDAAIRRQLAVDPEGEVKPKPQDKIIVPFLLLGFAAAPLVPDPGDTDEFVKNGAASNSLGLPGFIAGIAVNSMELSAGFGFYGASLSIYDRWIKRGADVTFPRNTRIILQTDVHPETAANREAKPGGSQP